MTNQYTPGPWHNAHDARSDYAEIVNQFDGVVCQCSNADAALIAAAPDLLAALKNAANVLAGIATGDLKTINGDSSALLQARAAIAKATSN